MKKFETEPLFLSAIRKNYPDQEEIYLARSKEQLANRAEQLEILPETIREYGKWYEVIPRLERLDVLGIAQGLRGLEEPYRIMAI